MNAGAKSDRQFSGLNCEITYWRVGNDRPGTGQSDGILASSSTPGRIVSSVSVACFCSPTVCVRQMSRLRDSETIMESENSWLLCMTPTTHR